MFSACRWFAPELVVSLAMAICPVRMCCQADVASSSPQLRVCADPNNLPFSNAQQQGFENRIAALIAEDTGRELKYFWLRQGERFFRQTLNRGVCDVVMGVPVGFDEAATTRPYYRSAYVLLTRKSSGLKIMSLDDPRLRTLRIGVQILGDQKDSLPPVNALLRRGIVKNLVGFSIFGNLTENDPAADVVRALAHGDVDIAIAWGPLAGFYSRKSSVPLEVIPLTDDPKDPDLPFHFDIAIGVRKQDAELKRALDLELVRRRREIRQILRSYGIPQVALPLQDDTATEAAVIGGDR